MAGEVSDWDGNAVTDVVILQTVEPPRPEDLKALMDEVQAAAKAAGITPERVGFPVARASLARFG